MTLKEMLYNIDGSRKFVSFTHYSSGNLWCETEDGFAFPVPVSDTGQATFKSKDFAPLFMRYIRKHLELLQQSKQS